MCTEELKAIITCDIEKCKHEIKNGNKESQYGLFSILQSKYAKIIDGFTDGLKDLFYDENGKKCLCNLQILLEKLEMFEAMDYKNQYALKSEDRSITFNNNNQVTVNLNLTFSEARERVENMSSLQEAEIEEILAKITELEKIVASKERKTKKWEQAKGIIKWVADKGVDVGIALLPLILKIGQ